MAQKIFLPSTPEADALRSQGINVKQSQPTLYFIGVTTTQSSIMKIFPRWMEQLNRPEVVIQGVDLKLHDDPENYRVAVARIKYDPLSLGALVTTHKINLLEAARDMFDYLDPYAVLCGEVSSISKNGAALEGHAIDPITAGLSLDAMLGPDYFERSGADMLCLGAGGATTAIILHLAQKKNSGERPQRVVVVNRSQARLDALRDMAVKLESGIVFEWHCNSRPEVNDELLAVLAEGSVVVNATGMGKDLPGCPLTEAAIFPLHGVAWELNYRGELDFMKLACSQRDARKLRIEDGWRYFLHGWTRVIAQILKVEIDEPLFEKLSDTAETCSPQNRLFR